MAIGLEVLLGVGALIGGGALLLAPDGHLLSMPATLLSGSPFRDYTIPGAILFGVLGVAPLGAAGLTWIRADIAPVAAVAVGLALIGWIATEMVVLAGWGSLVWTLYLLLGTAIAGTGLWWLRERPRFSKPR